MSSNQRDRSALLRAAGLPEPLVDALRSPRRPAEESWSTIAARLDALESRDAARGRRLPLALGLLSGLALVGVALASGYGPFTASSPVVTAPSERLSSETQASAPPVSRGLPLVDGSAFSGLRVPHRPELASTEGSSSERRARFLDGSSITGQPGTRLEALAMTERDVVLRLVEGSIEVSVVPGGARRWVIEAGTLSVEVVGTQFTLARDARGAQVGVTQGAVLVRSSQLEDGVLRLLAGERVQLSMVPEERTRAPASAPAEPQPSPSAAPATARDHVTALLGSADTARLRSELPRALATLQQVLRDYPHDPRAGLAAYQLAVVVEQLGHAPEEVVAAFEDASRRATGASLKQDCYYRLVQAQRRAGQLEAARSTARRALTEYPDGRYAERFRSHLEQDAAAR